MKKLLQINPVLRVSTSTGRIMQEIGELAMRNGWESYIAYSRGRDGIKPCTSKLVPVVHIPADTRSAFPVISVQSPVSIQYCWQS